MRSNSHKHAHTYWIIFIRLYAASHVPFSLVQNTLWHFVHLFASICDADSPHLYSNHILNYLLYSVDELSWEKNVRGTHTLTWQIVLCCTSITTHTHIPWNFIRWNQEIMFCFVWMVVMMMYSHGAGTLSEKLIRKFPSQYVESFFGFYSLDSLRTMWLNSAIEFPVDFPLSGVQRSDHHKYHHY